MKTQASIDAFDAIIALPFGPLGIACNNAHVQQIAFLPPEVPERTPRSPLAEQTVNVLQQWLKDPERPHNLPLSPQGTAFQNRVWTQIGHIPPGRTRTYRELADALGSAPRAVGGACGANPFPLLVPCHRVVGQHNLGGFARDTYGHLIRVKQWLLAHEANA